MTGKLPAANMKTRSVIGRTAIIRVNGEQYVGTVIDAKPGNRLAKRIRVQSPGARQGDVVMPGQYVVMEWAD